MSREVKKNSSKMSKKRQNEEKRIKLGAQVITGRATIKQFLRKSSRLLNSSFFFSLNLVCDLYQTSKTYLFSFVRYGIQVNGRVEKRLLEDISENEKNRTLTNGSCFVGITSRFLNPPLQQTDV